MLRFMWVVAVWVIVMPFASHAAMRMLRAPSEERLKSWMAPQHHTNTQALRAIRGHVESKWLPADVSAFEKATPLVPPNPGHKQGLGKVCIGIPPLDFAFLEEVRRVSDGSFVNVLEIAGAQGDMSVVVPFCFGPQGGRVWVNDLSEGALAKLGPLAATMFESVPVLKEMLHPWSGDIFALYEKSPHLKGTFQVVLVRNLEHYLTPLEHRKFVRIVKDLLVPGGKAFLCALAQGGEPGDAAQRVMDMRIAKGTPYPGYMRVTFNQGMRAIKATACAEEEPFASAQPMEGAKLLTTVHVFSPQVYARAYGEEGFKVLASFRANMGAFEKYREEERDQASHACIIVEKKPA